ncbi:MAG: hypothetical protein IJ785_03500 [Bacteroidales bacterium]|nr:hypothetical protein [Bacteroidales bacterium]
MKKIVLFLFLAACLQQVDAQIRYIYVPGDGERQFGLSLTPSYCAQQMGVGITATGPTGTEQSLSTKGTIDNNVGFSAGLFYGYETRHNRTIEFGNYATVYYSINPFSGTVSVERDGKTEQHEVKYTAQRILLHFNPFLSYSINDQFSLSAGLGVSLAPQLKSKVRYDGKPMDLAAAKSSRFDAFENLFMGLMNFHFDANVGAKYWFSDQLFCGARLQYCFYTLSILSLFGKDGEADLSEYPNGVVNLNLANGTGTANYFLPGSKVQMVLSLGYVW